MMRADPNVVEETATHFITRVPKKNVIRVDDRRIKHPIIGPPVEFFKEDDDYYYVQVQKPPSPEEATLRQAEAASAVTSTVPDAPDAVPTPEPASTLSAADFADLTPPRVSARFRLEPVATTGLPVGGMWRSSFVMADMNGDKIPDIVSPPARIGGSRPHVWIGDGTGKFSEWPLQFVESNSPNPNFSVSYGAVAVGDIDGDGSLDLVSASHAAGLVALFGDGRGTFTVVRRGLPGRDFSAQAIVLLDANSDGKLDLVASRDVVDSDMGVDRQQVRVYLFQGRAQGFAFQSEGLTGGFYSNSLHAWDHDRDAKQDVLTGSHYAGALTLLWRNEGNGTFSPVSFPAIEGYSYHFSTAPGTHGRERSPAFVDAYNIFSGNPDPHRATGLTVYAMKDGAWSRHRVWRKNGGNSLLYTAALGDLDGDGLDDVIFPDSEQRRLRLFLQQRDGSFSEAAQELEPALTSPGQCVRIVDLNRDGRLDVVLAKTVSSTAPEDPGGWSVYLNRR